MSRNLALLLVALVPLAAPAPAFAQDKVLVQDTPAPPDSPLALEPNRSWSNAKPPLDAPLPESHTLVKEPTEFVEQVYPDEMLANCGDCGGNACGCGACGCNACVPCGPAWTHRDTVYGEYLFLAPRGLDVAYAAASAPSTSNPSNLGIPAGGVGTTDFDYDSGYRAGFAWALSDCVSVQGAYTFFDTETNDAVTAAPGAVIRSLVTQPLTEPTAVNWQSASARQDVEFRFADLELRWLVHAGRCHAWNLTAGARYAQYDENFRADFAGAGTRRIDTAIEFEGGGLRLGLDFERYAAQTGFFAYGKGFANFLAGSFDTQFTQGGTLTPGAAAEWEDDRLVTILELELGLGWQSPNGCVRATAGYLVNGWFNMVTTESWIESVQTNQYDNRDETVVFDGLAARVEYRF